MSTIFTRYSAFLGRRPFIGNAISTALLFGTGDTLAQVLFPDKPTESISSQYDPLRTVRGMVYGGLIFSPMGSKWYSFLAHNVRFPAKISTKSSGTVQKLADTISRVAVDQLCWAPIGIPLYFTCMTLLEGYFSVGIIKAKLDEKYWETLVGNWSVWPAFQLVNFYFVPVGLRLLSVNFVSIFWNCYISYENNKANLLIEK